MIQGPDDLAITPSEYDEFAIRVSTKVVSHCFQRHEVPEWIILRRAAFACSSYLSALVDTVTTECRLLDEQQQRQHHHPATLSSLADVQVSWHLGCPVLPLEMRPGLLFVCDYLHNMSIRPDAPPSAPLRAGEKSWRIGHDAKHISSAAYITRWEGDWLARLHASSHEVYEDTVETALKLDIPPLLDLLALDYVVRIDTDELFALAVDRKHAQRKCVIGLHVWLFLHVFCNMAGGVLAFYTVFMPMCLVSAIATALWGAACLHRKASNNNPFVELCIRYVYILVQVIFTGYAWASETSNEAITIALRVFTFQQWVMLLVTCFVSSSLGCRDEPVRSRQDRNNNNNSNDTRDAFLRDESAASPSILERAPFTFLTQRYQRDSPPPPVTTSTTSGDTDRYWRCFTGDTLVPVVTRSHSSRGGENDFDAATVEFYNNSVVYLPISAIEKGHAVLGQEGRVQVVTATHSYLQPRGSELVCITASVGASKASVTCSPTHPFLLARQEQGFSFQDDQHEDEKYHPEAGCVLGKEWVCASDLRVGSQLARGHPSPDKNRGGATVTSIKTFFTNKDTRLYTLTTEPSHSFTVSALHLVVHNKV